MMKKYLYYFTSIFTLLAGIQEWPTVIAIFLGLDHSSPTHSIHLRKNGLRVTVRGKMDVWSVKEALLDHLYERYGFPVPDGWTVVDVGAGIGEFTLSAVAGKKANRVLAFEPFPESYSLLNENLAQNQVTGVETFPLAVWDHNGRLKLDLSGGEPLQLTSQEGDASAAAEGKLAVPCCSLSDQLDRLGISRVDLLKLDCEGAEYAILFNLAPQIYPRIQRIVMEYHDGVTAHNHPDLAAFLEGQGYRVQLTPNVVHGNIGYLSAERLSVPTLER